MYFPKKRTHSNPLYGTHKSFIIPLKETPAKQAVVAYFFTVQRLQNFRLQRFFAYTMIHCSYDAHCPVLQEFLKISFLMVIHALRHLLKVDLMP